MKNKFFIALLCFGIFPFLAKAQITTSHAAVKAEEKPVIAPYDSTRNFLGKENVTSYIGQVLFVNGRSKTLQGYGYDNFKTSKEPSVLKGRYGEPAKESEYNTKYEDLYGKYFVVKDVQKDSRASQSEYLYGKKYWFLLENQNDSTDIAWFEYDGDFEHSFPFIVVSYFNYVKNQYLGKTYISSFFKNDDGSIREGIGQTDFATGETIKPGTNHYWTCVDLTIEDKYFNLSLVFKDEQGQTVIYEVNYFDPSEDSIFTVMEKSNYLALCNKYGTETMNKVRQHKIWVGMPEKLIKMSWGTPRRINRSSQGPDQWCYEDQYIYVQNGKVTAWN